MHMYVYSLPVHKHQLYLLEQQTANHLKFGQQLVGLTLGVNP